MIRECRGLNFYNCPAFPHYSLQLIYTGGGTKSAITRSLVEGLLFDGGKGPLINAEALSNNKVSQSVRRPAWHGMACFRSMDAPTHIHPPT